MVNRAGGIDWEVADAMSGERVGGARFVLLEEYLTPRPNPPPLMTSPPPVREAAGAPQMLFVKKVRNQRFLIDTNNFI